MKTIYTIVMAMLLSSATQAQFDFSNFSASLSGNYTMYKGDFQQKTPGGKFELAYSISEKHRAGLSYTFHSPIKLASTISYFNGTSSQSLASEVKYNFTTISLVNNYSFIGTEESPFSVYAMIGGGFVSVKYSESPKGSVPAGYTAQDQLTSDKESGLTINAGLGAQYNFGMLRAFADAGIALPANQQGNTIVYNSIPTHFIFNVGLRIPFGARDGGDEE